MSTLSIAERDKERFVELKPDEKTHKEFFAEMLHTYEHADETVEIDTERIVDQIKEEVAPAIELSSYRGVKEALEDR